MTTITVPKSIVKLCTIIKQKNGTAYIVGGVVRDALLNIENKDYDIEVYHLSFAQLKNIANKLGPVNEVGKSFCVLKLQLDNLEVDLSLPRTEKKIDKGHKGFDVTGNSNLSFKEAAKRRDFTINSIGYDPLAKTIIDPYNGINDLKNKQLKHVSPAFTEDPLRVFRAMQFAARFELKIDESTIKLAKQCPLDELPKERIYEEIKKLCLKSSNPSIGINYWEALGILPMFPELNAIKNIPQDPEWHPEGDVWDHTMMVVDELAKFEFKEAKTKLILSLAAICHDFGKATTTQQIDGRWRSPGHEQAGVKPTLSFLKRFCNEKEIIDRVCSLVNCHLRPALLYNAHQTQKVSNAAIRRLALQVNINELYTLAKADHFGRTTPDALARQFPAGEWLKKRAEACQVSDQKPTPILQGRDLIPLGIKPGPKMGKLLEKAFQAQLDEHFSTKKDAILWLHAHLGQNKQ